LNSISQIIILAGRALGSPYLRTFLLFSEPLVCKNLSITLAESMIENLHISSQAYMYLIMTASTLVEYLLFSPPCPRGIGGDGKCCLPETYRKTLSTSIFAYLAHAHIEDQATRRRIHSTFKELAELLDHIDTYGYQALVCSRAELDRLCGYLRCARETCAERGRAVCGRCQCTRYCSRRCQRVDWRTHRVRCFKTSFRGIKIPDAPDECIGMIEEPSKQQHCEENRTPQATPMNFFAAAWSRLSHFWT
jgi:hypothetical protein